MQLCALGANGDLVGAIRAERHIDYCCLECGKVVRLRKGFHRQPHFYHVQPNNSCAQSGKGLVHLSVQKALLDLLPEGQAAMEHRFTSIGRIADIVWYPQQIVFEIQCASITAEEVMARNMTYATLGYDVVWILHTNRYNKTRMTSAEDILKNHAHYYTDIDTEGEGTIYDQFAVCLGGKRIWRFPRAAIDVTRPYRPQVAEGSMRFLKRYSKWSRGFVNDTLHRYQEGVNDEFHQQLHICLQRLQREEVVITPDMPLSELLERLFRRWILYPYQVLFRHLLEKASR